MKRIFLQRHHHPILLKIRRWLFPCMILVLLVWMARPQVHPVQASQQVEFRVSRLESETRTLRSQINQLESELNRIARTTGQSRPDPVVISSQIDDFPSIDESTPSFDRLATLVIETRQDMFLLQEQVGAIADQLGIRLTNEES
ncbi:MAG: hypothetical protein AAF327_12615 [Cyanobacteria bacterium P01_A01_bin.37]